MVEEQQGERRSPRPADPRAMGHYYADDEISLFDLWDVVVRRRWVIFLVAAGVTALAFLYAVTQPEVYAWRSAIEIGSYVSSEEEMGRRYIEPLSAVRHRLEEAAVPAARKAVDQPEQPAPEIDVRTQAVDDDGQGTGLFVLSTEASPDRAEQVERLHRTVVTDVRDRHAQLLSPIETRLQNRLEDAREQLAFLERPEVERSRIEPLEQAVVDAERKLSALETQYRNERLELENRLAAKERQATGLEDDHALIEARLARMDEREQLVKEQLASLQARIAQLEDANVQATADIREYNDAMTLLTVGTQIDQARNRADQLEERLRVGIPEQRDELRDNLGDNERAQENVADEIAAIRNELDTLRVEYERNRADAEDALALARTRLARDRANYENDLAEGERVVRDAEIALQELRPTEALFVSDRSIRPVGTGATTIVALGVILGGMLGVFAAFFAEFVHAAGRQRREMDGGREVEDGVEE